MISPVWLSFVKTRLKNSCTLFLGPSSDSQAVCVMSSVHSSNLFNASHGRCPKERGAGGRGRHRWTFSSTVSLLDVGSMVGSHSNRLVTSRGEWPEIVYYLLRNKRPFSYFQNYKLGMRSWRINLFCVANAEFDWWTTGKCSRIYEK